ncbi:unnamed protein product [Rhizopus stolonifer]
MDPRMDAGVNVNSAPFDIHQRLTADETLEVMDQLVVRELAWLSGHSLSQTVYTCIYLHHLKELNQLSLLSSEEPSDMIYSALRIYLLATIKCCHYIWSEMSQRNLFEGEDFTSHLFGLSFNHQLPDISILNDLDMCILGLHRIDARQLLHRIELRKSYLLALMHLSRNKAAHLTQAKAELGRVLQILRHLDFSSKEIKTAAFDPSISRKLSTYTPPRPARLDTKTEAYSNYSKMIHHLLSVCDMVNYTSVISLMNFFEAFGSSLPDAFSRSKLITMIFHDKHIFGTRITNLIIRCIQEMTGLPDTWLSPTCSSFSSLKIFLERISTSFLELFRIHCHNRSRQRRLLQKMLKEWQWIENEANQVDRLFQQDLGGPGYLSLWVYWIKLTMMEKILVLGFKLELYGSHEYSMILWYYLFLLQSRLFLLQKIEPRTDYLKTEIYMTLARSLMIGAVLKMVRKIEKDGQWSAYKPLMDDERTRYWQRLKPFSKATPLPSYENFVRAQEQDDLDIDRLEQDLSIARELLDKVYGVSDEMRKTEMCSGYFKKNIEIMMATCEANKAGLDLVKNGEKVSLGFKQQTWLVIQRKE